VAAPSSRWKYFAGLAAAAAVLVGAGLWLHERPLATPVPSATAEPPPYATAPPATAPPATAPPVTTPPAEVLRDPVDNVAPEKKLVQIGAAGNHVASRESGRTVVDLQRSV